MWIALAVVVSVVVLVILYGVFGQPRNPDLNLDRLISQAKAKDQLAGLLSGLDGQIDRQTSRMASNAGPERIRRLVKEFDSLSYDEASLASMALVKIGGPAIPFLIDALKERKGNKCTWVGVTLGKMGKKARVALPVLRQIAQDPRCRADVREEAEQTIREILGR